MRHFTHKPSGQTRDAETKTVLQKGHRASGQALEIDKWGGSWGKIPWFYLGPEVAALRPPFPRLWVAKRVRHPGPSGAIFVATPWGL